MTANLVSARRDYKVAVIGLDLLFDEPDDINRDHHALAAKLGAAASAPVIAAALPHERTTLR